MSVRIGRAQAEQYIGFNREFAAAHPGLLGPHHLLLGAMKARANAYGRRAVYRWLDRRMQIESGADKANLASGDA